MGKPINPELGARARALREELGITPNQMASDLAVTRQRLHQMETDGVSGLALIEAWADLLGTTASFLIFGAEKPTTKPRTKQAKKAKAR